MRQTGSINCARFTSLSRFRNKNCSKIEIFRKDSSKKKLVKNMVDVGKCIKNAGSRSLGRGWRKRRPRERRDRSRAVRDWRAPRPSPVDLRRRSAAPSRPARGSSCKNNRHLPDPRIFQADNTRCPLYFRHARPRAFFRDSVSISVNFLFLLFEKHFHASTRFNKYSNLMFIRRLGNFRQSF